MIVDIRRDLGDVLLKFSMLNFPLSYDPLYWGAVFPLGRHTAATFRLAGAIGMPALINLPRITVYVAVLAWAAAFVGFLRRMKSLIAANG